MNLDLMVYINSAYINGAYDSIMCMCEYFCIEFINYMLKGKTLLDYTNLFSPNDFKKNDRVIKRIFKNE